MTNATPRRIVLRFHNSQEGECTVFAKKFFECHPEQATNDYYERLVPQQEESSKMHIVPDMHYQQFPSADIEQIPYHVFKVFKSKGSDE